MCANFIKRHEYICAFTINESIKYISEIDSSLVVFHFMRKESKKTNERTNKLHYYKHVYCFIIVRWFHQHVYRVCNEMKIDKTINAHTHTHNTI